MPTSIPIALTAEFSSDPIKARQWQAFVTKAGLQSSSLDAVIETLALFMGPALASIIPGNAFQLNWNPVARVWEVDRSR